MKRVFAAAILIILMLPLLHAEVTTTTSKHLPNKVGNITISVVHEPTYHTIFTRLYSNSTNATGYRFTINYTRVPKILQGVTPKLPRPTDRNYDIPRNAGNVTLDPRTCAGELAFCYQIIDNNETTNNITRGKNYSALSAYALPKTRLRTFVCIGDDLECVKRATGCSCPEQDLPPPPPVWGQQGKCSDQSHLCLNSYASFTLCTGNLTSCQEQYNICGCGKHAACPAAKNTCVNERNELVSCSGELSQCLGQYKTCFCGEEMLLQKSCASYIHRCTRKGMPYTCYGEFNACAMDADTCAC